MRKGLDKNFGKGRIYRIVHEQIKPDGKPNLLDKSAKQLLGYLGHANGWYRDTAQKLIVLKGDKSVVSELKKMVTNNESFWTDMFGDKDYALERVHALWTLEGLGIVDKELIIKKLKDMDSRVRITAIRLSDKFLKNGDVGIISDLKHLQSDKDINVVNQLALSMRYSASSDATEILNSIADNYKKHEIISVSVAESLKKDDSELQNLKKRIAERNNGDINRILKGYDTYKMLCTTCHGPDLKGVPNGEDSFIAPSLIGSERVTGDKETLIKILLHGLVGPIDGKDYGIMLPMGSNDNNWIANVISYIRAMNDTSVVHGGEVNQVRKENSDRDTYWTLKELKK